MKKIISLFLLITIFYNCSGQDKNTVENKSKLQNNDILLMSTLFHQKAAEMRAIYYQIYNLATLRLDNELRMAGLSKTLAVVVDIDETVLDNSPFEAKSILENTNYPKYWGEWCELAQAKAIHGAVEFLSYAESKGVEVFYITNRKEKFKTATIENLKKEGFPFADKKHLLMRTTSSSKKERRESVGKTHKVVLIIGDNLGDFLDIFDKNNINRRFEITDSLKNEFGKRFIILPNSMYGTWINTILNFQYDLTPDQKLDIFHENLESFE
jgi:5'-nucleotidase (lipoprotein e(P4) family)